MLNDSEGGEPSIEPSSFLANEKTIYHRDEMQTTTDRANMMLLANSRLRLDSYK